MSHDVLEIGLFQLENLTSTPTMFLFYDLRAMPTPVGPEIDRLLRRAERVSPHDLEIMIEKMTPNKHTPVVLICENGRQAGKAAGRLAKAGYTNVCVVEDGVAGLSREV